MTKESSDRPTKIILIHYLMITKIPYVTYFPKISVSSYSVEKICLSFLLLKYRYLLCGEDMISSSEVHDKGDPVMQPFSKPLE